MRMSALRTAAIVLLALPMLARGELQKKTIEYRAGDATCRGYLVYDDAKQDKRPGVLVVPEWWGLNDYPKKRAEMLAELGYVAFAADIYGEGKVTTDPKEAGQLAGKFRGDRALLRERAAAALKTLKDQPQVDGGKIAAIGYCFGGTTVLELARSGAEVNGIVSFHGGLDAPTPAKAGDVKAKVLVLAGGDDPMVLKEQVQALEKEMKDANAECKVISYPGAVHSFTNPDADKLQMKGIGYNKEADEKSWQAMQEFFGQLFK